MALGAPAPPAVTGGAVIDLGFMGDAVVALLQGLPLTLELFAASILWGGLLACLLAVMRAGGGVPAGVAGAYVFVFRGTPLLVQLFLIYYGLSQFPEVRRSVFWPFLRDPFWCAVLALSLNTAAYTSEIIRGALAAVPPGQIEAARACGMARATLLRRIVLPVALRQGLPAYSTEVILMTKATALASIVTLKETMFIAARLNSETYRAIEVFLCAGAVYLVLNILISRAFALLEWHLSPDLRRAPEPLPGLGTPLDHTGLADPQVPTGP